MSIILTPCNYSHILSVFNCYNHTATHRTFMLKLGTVSVTTFYNKYCNPTNSLQDFFYVLPCLTLSILSYYINVLLVMFYNHNCYYNLTLIDLLTATTLNIYYTYN